MAARHNASSLAGKATFSFVAPSAASAKATSTKAQLHFNVVLLSFRSENFRPVAVQGVHGKFDGTATINGAGGYKFTLDTTAGEAVGQGAPSRAKRQPACVGDYQLAVSGIRKQLART
jgi:hypothetical protein